MDQAARPYVHGYDEAANTRLNDQASALEGLLHDKTFFPPGSRILEAGCGVGAQTMLLARNNPDAEILSVDISAPSLAEAAGRANAAGLGNVRFLQADLFNLPLEPSSYDHVFVCFVLEHLADPVGALGKLRAVLRPAGTITLIEGDHGSAYFHPDSEAARSAIRAQVELQRRAGGDANIGRRLYPLLNEAGFTAVEVSPRMVYVDGSRPDLGQSFTRKTFAAMIEGVREPAIAAKLIHPEAFEEGVRALRRTAEPDGVFCYTFFRATAVREGR